MPSCRSATKLWFSYKDSHQFHLKHNVCSCLLQSLCISPNDSNTFYKTSHVRIIMTDIIAARVLLLVRGFSSKVEWTAKMSHVSIKVIALNFIKSHLFPRKLYTFSQMHHVCIKVNFIMLDKLAKHLVVCPLVY